MSSPKEPNPLADAQAIPRSGGPEPQGGTPLRADLLLIEADPTAIILMEDPAPELQLAALAKRMDLYWKIQNPCEDATIEYLARRPYDLHRFGPLSDDLKAKVITKSPELIYDWIKRAQISSPVEPDGFHYAVIREFLIKIKRGTPGRSILSAITRMRLIGYQWDEFDIIERSLKADEETMR